MSRRKRELSLSQADVPASLLSRLRPPVLLALGSPAEAAHLVASAPDGVRPTCWQLDLFQSERLRATLAEQNASADVVATADLWDVTAEGSGGFQTVVFLPARGGERELKIDVVEQAY